MQLIDTDAPDSQLAAFVDPTGRSYGVRIDDSPEKLIARPCGIPMWFVCLSLAAPVGVAIWYWVGKAFQGGLGSADFVGITIASLAAPSLLAIIHALNVRILSKGDYFVLDKEKKRLILPRVGVTLEAGHIRGFVEVRGWHRLEGTGGNDQQWIAELTVLAAREDGKLARYPVVTNDYTRPVSRLGETLAEFFFVERRLVRLGSKLAKSSG